MDLLLGIDAGTTNVKAVLTEPDGRVVASAHASYATHRPRPGWAEQDPDDWWNGMVGAVRQVVAAVRGAPERIAGIAVSGQGCAVTLVDTNGVALRPAIIWMDTRSEPQAAALRACCEADVLARSGKLPAPYNADPVLVWLAEHEPDVLGRAACSLTTTGYLTSRLTGTAVMNVSDASILLAFDLRSGGWSEASIDAFGLPRCLYPALAPCDEVVDTLAPATAAALGLPTDIPVVAGGEDTSSAGLAVGVTQPGQTLLSLGTAGTVYVCQASPTVDRDLLAFLHVVPERLLVGGSMVALGAALAWYRDAYLPGSELSDLTHLASTSPPCAGGVVFLPYLSGELQPINDGNARGAFIGMSLSTEARHMARALLEGTAFAIRHNLTVAREAGATIDVLRAVGGPTKDPFWCQIIADVTGHPVEVLEPSPGAPLGNALLAARGVGLISDVAGTAAAAATVSRTFTPDDDHHVRYGDTFGVYRALYPRLAGAFRDLAGIDGATGGTT